MFDASLNELKARKGFKVFPAGWEWENFLTWTKVDPNFKLSETQQKASWTDLIRNEACYRYKARTLNDFKAQFDFQLASIDVNATFEDQFLLYLFVVCENYGRPYYVEVNESIKLAILEFENSTSIFRLYLHDSGDSVQDISVDLNVGTTYYCLFERKGNSVTLNIYSDPERTVLVDSISITLPPEVNVTFNYAEVTASVDSALDGNDQSDGFIQNLGWQ